MVKKTIYLLLVVALITTNFANEGLKKVKQLIEEQSFDEAKKILLEITEYEETNHEAFYHLARVYFWQGNLDDATDNAEQAVELKNDNADYHFLLGQIYGRDARDASVFRQPFLAKNCKNEFKRTIELDPNHIGGNMGLAEFMFYAPGIVGGDSEEAIKIAENLLKIDEKSGADLLSKYLVAEGKLEEAKTHIDKLIELDEIRGRLRYLNYLGAKKDSVEGENQFKILETLIGENKDYFWFYNSYGYALLNDGRIDEAIGKFEIQLKLVPERANAWDSMGEAYFRKGNYTEAKKYYEKALKINPELESSEEKLEEIEEIISQ